MARRVKVRSRLPSGMLNDFLKQVPGILSGKKPNKYRLYNIFWGAVAYSMYTSISKAYVRKSEGKEDELGNTWPDLSTQYKAYKRPATNELPSNLRRRLKPSNNTLGLLTPSQHRRWQKIFGHVYHSNKERLGDSKAKELAGQLAWTRLKAQGAQTKKEVLGERKLLIMRVSDKLLVSLSPGKFSPGSGYSKRNHNQIFELSKRSLKIGTNLEYATFHDDSRPVWPEEMEEWIDKAMDDGMNAVMARLQTVLR